VYATFIRRSLVLALTVAATLMGLALPASAARPIIFPSEPFEIVAPYPDICSFPLTATINFNTHTIMFVDEAGNLTRGFTGGQLFVTWTRDDTGFSRRFAVSGPSFFDEAFTVLRSTGRSVTSMEGAGLVLASGNLTYDSPDVIATLKGHAVSICDLMS
jgi:hypothetical protein